MEIVIRKYEEKDLCAMIEIWNEIVEEGNAFPQEEFLTLESGAVFFAEQTYTGVAVDAETEKIYGLYIFASEQYRKMRSYLQCKLCCQFA